MKKALLSLLTLVLILSLAACGGEKPGTNRIPGGIFQGEAQISRSFFEGFVV